MANDTPGSDAPSVGRADETTFSPRPDLPAADAAPPRTPVDDAQPAAPERAGREQGASRSGSWGAVPTGTEQGAAGHGTRPSAAGAASSIGSWGAVPPDDGRRGPVHPGGYGDTGRRDAPAGGGAPTGAMPGSGPSGGVAGYGPAGGYGGPYGGAASGSGSAAAYGPGGGHGPGGATTSGPGDAGSGSRTAAAYGPGNTAGHGPDTTAGYGARTTAGYGPGTTAGYGPGSGEGYGTGTTAGYGPGTAAGYGQGSSAASGPVGTGAYASPGGVGQQAAVRPGGPPTGQQPAVGWGGPPAPRQRRGPGWGALVAVGVVAALLGGLFGAFGAGLVGGSGGSSGVLGAPVPDAASASAPVGPVEAVAERVLPSVVQLRVEGQGSAGEGSGIVLSADGLILTNNHVVEAAAGGGGVTVVFQDGGIAPAQIVGLDPTSDLAVIRAEGRDDLTPAELGNSDAVRVGQQVVAFGSPLGLGGTVTSGIISAVDRAVSVGEESGASEATVLNALQTDAAINPGNSGGPLTDMEGRIIGINSVIATTGQQGGSIGVGFAIPVNQARRIATELEATGRATRSVLGVSLAPDDARSLSGAVVQGVTPGGAAEQAGIRPGDVIVRFGDQRITNAIELQAAVRSHPPGEPAEVELADRTLQVTPTAESG